VESDLNSEVTISLSKAACLVLFELLTVSTSGVGAVAGAFADALKTFSAGMLVSTAIFACAVFCERLIHRHQLGLTRRGSVRPNYND
jgi:hypothetical protein